MSEEVVVKKETVTAKKAGKKETKKSEDTAKVATDKVDAGTAEAKSATEVGAEPVKRGKKKGKKHIPVGVVHIQSTFNNTIITFADVNGNTVSWATSGGSGFKGSRKSTPFAAQIAAETATSKARDAGMRTVSILLKGPGSGRESAVRAIQKSGMRITGIRDVTPIPHNGCRPPKRRRV